MSKVRALFIAIVAVLLAIPAGANPESAASPLDQSESAATPAYIDEPKTLEATPILPGPISVGDWVTFNIRGTGWGDELYVIIRSCTVPEGDIEATEDFDCFGPFRFGPVEADGTFEYTYSRYQITREPFVLLATNSLSSAVVSVPIAPQRLGVVPPVVTAVGEHELELRGRGWTPNTELFVTPCTAPQGDRRAIDSATDCDNANPTSVQTSADGRFWMRNTFNVGENFALHVSNQTSTETMSARVWIANPELCGGNIRLATIRGTVGDDVLIGTNGPDIIAGGGGNDRIIGMGGDDLICSGRGDDRVFAGAGDDAVFGEGGIDKIRGGAGDDYIDGGYEMDFLKGGDGEDRILGDHGPDRIRAGRDDDRVEAGFGDDRIWGGPGNDQIFAVLGNNIVNGGAGLSDECYFGLGPYLESGCEIVALP